MEKIFDRRTKKKTEFRIVIKICYLNANILTYQFFIGFQTLL